ncbi:hypothetical protein TNIN_22091 [Trichonephila inaurata madagascariensis]|uniref:Uncharacterized protein n=1 Tax=Trichonephila inaurata madagascariensis TaxID=2747483 RepID=A0A8X7CJR7_9ARAC|nr:hypothetical protein TNIN_22091 [Trichonephila inaurata madagascariensis]
MGKPPALPLLTGSPIRILEKLLAEGQSPFFLRLLIPNWRVRGRFLGTTAAISDPSAEGKYLINEAISDGSSKAENLKSFHFAECGDPVTKAVWLCSVARNF